MTARGVIDAARRAAYDTVRAVDERDAYANLVLPGLLRERDITDRDAAFATEVAYGTLRSLGTYDAVIEECSSRPIGDIDAPVRDVLRLGVHQLLAMRVPPHAAVGETVDLASVVAGRRSTGFVNAVLRKVGTRDYDGWMSAIAPAFDEDPVGHLALVHAHPRWIVEVYRDALGGNLDETARALAADNVAAPVHLVARPGRMTRDDLLAQVGANGRPGRWSPYAVHLTKGDPGAIDAVRNGRAGVQDEGSQLAALALVAADVAGPERRWLDTCAGPGGKAALLAGHAAERGAHLLAADRSMHRAGLAAAAIGAAAGTLVVTADGTRPAWPAGTFDRVLVDAPCTGLGALRRRPEARWRRSREDADRLQPMQIELLDMAVTAVRRGGVVAYVTCSPDRRETDAVVSAVIERQPVTQMPIGLPAVIPDGESEFGRSVEHPIQLWPHRHDTDAMYIAVLRRDS